MLSFYFQGEKRVQSPTALENPSYTSQTLKHLRKHQRYMELLRVTNDLHLMVSLTVSKKDARLVN